MKGGHGEETQAGTEGTDSADAPSQASRLPADRQ